MKIRTIKPQFFEDEALNQCDPMARLLFIGLWMEADDAGVFPWKLSVLAGKIFPGQLITRENMDTWLKQLITIKSVEQYDNSLKESFGRIPSWSRHQVINHPTDWRHDYDMRKPAKQQSGNSPPTDGQQSDNCRSPNGKGNLNGNGNPKRKERVAPLFEGCMVFRCTPEQFQSLEVKYPDAREYILYMDDVMASKGITYKDYPAAFRTWKARDVVKQGAAPASYDWRNDPAVPPL